MFLLPFKQKRYKRLFLPSAFYIFVLITVSFEIICTLFIYYFSYNSYLSRIQSEVVVEANRIEVTLLNVFSETHQVMTYVGKQIALYAEADPHSIENILNNSSEFVSKMKHIYSWSLFDWVDSNNYRIFNSQIGRMQNIPTKINESYTQECPKYPWTLQLSHPSIGQTSGMWVIPAGLGVVNQNNQYLGALNVGFNIAELNAKIQQALASKTTSFIILDKECRIVLQSAENSIDPKSSYYRDLLSDRDELKEEKASLSPPLVYKNINYTYYKKIKGYPYIILTGFDKNLVHQDFLALILPRLLELYGAGAFFLCLLYLLRKKLFSLGKISDVAKKPFLQRINSEMKESIEVILAYSNILLKHLQKETGVVVTAQRRIEFMEKIYKEALHLHTLAGTSLSFNYLTVNALIENSIDILTETALQKAITIKTSLDPTLLPFYGDEHRLKQIIVGLISLSMHYSPKNSTIKISTLTKVSPTKQMSLIIMIEDNGFSLNAEDIKRLSEKFDNTEEEDVFGSSLDFASIEKLIHLHKGTYDIGNKSQGGKVIEVTLPYGLGEENSIKTKDPLPDENNVHWLFDKA